MSVINLRVTANSGQGHRKYMEDCYKIRFQRENRAHPSSAYDDTGDPQSDILFSYFGIFDGHGGKEASQFAKERLYWKIVELDDFWSDDDSKVLGAIRTGFVQCHMEMWNELANWPKTASGLPSTSGSTATVLFIKKSKAYVGHVGDSGLLIGYCKTCTDGQSSNRVPWYGKKLTRDHKPEDPVELKRIQSCGGSVMVKSGINRVVWNRPIPQHNHNTRKNVLNLTTSASTGQMSYLEQSGCIQTEKVPFLAVARSLGDLWSYDRLHDEFAVSPVPDVFCFELNPEIHKCLILATDGLLNVMRPNETIELVRLTDRETEKLVLKSSASSSVIANSTALNATQSVQPFINPSQRLVQTAVQKCSEKMIRADNTTCITIMIDQPPNLNSKSANKIKSSNKKLEKLMQNKTLSGLSNRFDLDSTDQDLDDITIMNVNESTKLGKTFTHSIIDDASSEFTTPISSDKRSRSLISLRRRHWSASSNRSSANHATTASSYGNSATNSTYTQNKHVSANKKYVNTDERTQNRLFVNSKSGYNFRNTSTRSGFNTSNSESNVASYAKVSKPTTRSNLRTHKSSNDAKAFSNMNNNMNVTSVSVNPRMRQSKTNSSKKSLNASTVSAFIGLNKLTKSVRKSLNDVYAASSNEMSGKTSLSKSNVYYVNEEESKENKKLKTGSTNSQNSLANRYVKSFKSFKERLIQTKNNLLNRKRKNNADTKSQEISSMTKKSKSQYDFSDHDSRNKTFQNLYNYRENVNEYENDNINEFDGYDDYDDEDYSNDDDDDDDYYDKVADEPTRENQSFVEHFKSKLNYVKRNRPAQSTTKSAAANKSCTYESVANNNFAFQSKRA